MYILQYCESLKEFESPYLETIVLQKKLFGKPLKLIIIIDQHENNNFKLNLLQNSICISNFLLLLKITT